MADIDITKLIAAAGIKQVDGVDDCYIVHLDHIEHVAGLVLDEASKKMRRRGYRAAADELRTIAEGLKP